MSRFLPLLALTLSSVTPMHAHDVHSPMAAAASAWLESLPETLRPRAVFDFGSAERENWHFVPRSRRGIAIKDMSDEQWRLARSLLEAGLSEAGYAKATGILVLEDVLAEIERNPAHRDSSLYYVTIFGDPSGHDAWGWRFEGHHVSLNFTCPADGGQPTVTPHFMGANPAEVRHGPHRGLRVLGREEDLARDLAESLSPEQWEQALIMSRAPADVLNIPGRNVTEASGIAWSDLTPPQQEALLELVREYVERHRGEIAEAEMKRLEDEGFEKLHFAWAGPIERGAPHYYRVQGGSFVIEYDNTQNQANHAHSLWRDFDRDFGRDRLAEHYLEHEH